MRHRRGILLLLIVALSPHVLIGCTPSYGFTKSIFGNPLRAEFCDSVRAFVRSPLDVDGIRRAWFLPFGTYEDGSFDFYAPMSARPMDDAAAAFYEKRVGQLTHYTFAPEFAFEMSKCLTSHQGFAPISRIMQDDYMRGSFVDKRSKRQIEIMASCDTTSILIASVDWTGDIEQSMKFAGSSDCEQ